MIAIAIDVHATDVDEGVDDEDDDDDDDDDDDIYIMMKCLFVTKNHHFLL